MNKQLERDIYYLRIAREVSKKSKCLSRKIGAVLVKDNAIISTGYNGPARGVKHCDERDLNFYLKLDKHQDKLGNTSAIIRKCPRKILGYKSGEGLHLCQAGHAERNALIQAARNGVSTLNTTLYCYCCGICKDCAIESINAGVNRIVHLEGKDYDEYSKIILGESNITITKIKKEVVNGRTKQ